MSNIAMNWVFDLGGITRNERLMLLKVANHADDEHGWTLKQGGIAEAFGISRSTVQRDLKKLAEKNLLRIIPQFGYDGGRRSNRYELPIPPASTSDATPSQGCLGDASTNESTIPTNLPKELPSNPEVDILDVQDILNGHKDTLPNTAEEIIAGVSKHTAGEITKLWKDLNSFYFPEVFQAEYGIKDKGMIGKIIKKIETHELVEVIHSCIQDWYAFRKYANENGKWVKSETPAIPQVLYAVSEAVNFYRSGNVQLIAAPGKELPAIDKQQSNEVESGESVEEQVATQEEILAALQDFEK